MNPEWLLKIVDKSETGGTYALHLEGLNLNTNETFFWTVDAKYVVSEPRYDWSRAQVSEEAQRIIKGVAQ